jgi:hypothetical protein
MPAIPPFVIPSAAAGIWTEVLNGGTPLVDGPYVLSSELYDFTLTVADAPPTLAASAIPVPAGTPHPVLIPSGSKLYVRGIVGTVINVAQ